MQLSLIADKLIQRMHSFDSLVVAFSGGLDSSVVAKAAQLAHGNRGKEKILAITAWSPSSCSNEQEEAGKIAKRIGIHHLIFESLEFDDPEYLRNDRERCFHCKRIRFTEMLKHAKERNFQIVVDGSNFDDKEDFRPGTRAARELGIRSPLLELGITKTRVREIAKLWELPNWNAPARPCLSTRISYGIPLKDSLLRKVEQAESFLRLLGFSHFRVRVHENDLIRIEVPQEQAVRFHDPLLREEVLNEFYTLGARFITIDLAGFKSGSMN